MSYAPFIDLDEPFEMCDLDWNQLHQQINLVDGLFDDSFHDFEIMEHDEGLKGFKCIDFHNNDDIEYLNYVYGERQDLHHNKYGTEILGELNDNSSPDWGEEDLIPIENLDKLERFSIGLFNEFIGIDYQVEQKQFHKEFDSISDKLIYSKNLKADNVPGKSSPQILHFDYDGIKINQKVEACNLVNLAANPISESTLILILSRLNKRKESEEKRIFSVNRTRYTRANIDSLCILHPNVQYQRNAQFSIDKPYEPEYIRVQMNPVTNAPFNETRCGLCPYCPNLVFKNLKTSTYAQHLSLTHGVQTDNYITPNPLLYGSYNLKKNNTNRKTRAHISEKNGVMCPVCHDIVETECSKTTASQKPLNNYLRHFKEKHRKCKEKGDPIKFFSKFSTNILKLSLMLSNL